MHSYVKPEVPPGKVAWSNCILYAGLGYPVSGIVQKRIIE